MHQFLQKRHPQLLFTLILLSLGLTTQWAQAKAIPPNNSLAPVLEKILPAVVNISTQSSANNQANPLFNDPFFRRFFNLPNNQQRKQAPTRSKGSGVIVNASKGYILTNHHVIKNADEIVVTLRDKRVFSATIVGQDPEVDLALLKIDATDLKQLQLSSSEHLRVGDFVVAIGNPFGLGQTVTYGIISALGRSGLGIEGYENFIQTDASINPGNSGGALITTSGELIGINTAIVGPSGGNVGIGFAIPSSMAISVVDQLIAHGKVERGQLGILIQDVTPDLAEAFHLEQMTGAIVSRVMPNTAAESAGLKDGDVIVALNGKRISSSTELRNRIGLMRIGTKINLDIIRNSRNKRIEATISKPIDRQVRLSQNLNKQLEGAIIGDIRRNHTLSGSVHGVEVLEVEQGSPAWRVGLRKEDIIVSLNRKSVQSVESFQTILERSSNTLLLNIRRGNAALYIVIR